jgi:hypothetical protein
VIDTFDRTWYGYENVTPEEFERYRQQVESARKL